MIEIQAQRVWEWQIGKQGFHKLLKKNILTSTCQK